MKQGWTFAKSLAISGIPILVREGRTQAEEGFAMGKIKPGGWGGRNGLREGDMPVERYGAAVPGLTVLEHRLLAIVERDDAVSFDVLREGCRFPTVPGMLSSAGKRVER